MSSSFFRSFDVCALIGIESAIFVGTVAKGLIRRLAAAAERDSRLVAIERKRIPLGIDESERSLNNQRAARSQTNSNFGHKYGPQYLAATLASRELRRLRRANYSAEPTTAARWCPPRLNFYFLAAASSLGCSRNNTLIDCGAAASFLASFCCAGGACCCWLLL